MELAVAMAAAFCVVAIVALLLFANRRPALPPDLSTPLQNLASAVQSTNMQIAVVAERLGHVAQRVTSMEEQHRAGQAGLTDVATAIRAEVGKTQQEIAVLHAEVRARQEVDRKAAESIHRLEAVIAGTATKGAAGESIIERVFARLPAEWQVRDFEVGNKKVEFGLRLPNRLVLPIDSKWPATALLEQFLAADSPAERQRLKQAIEAAVVNKASEVRKYLDPSLTMGFGVAVVPDAVYDLCGEARVKAMGMGVVLVSTSLFIPYLLLVFQTVLRTTHDVDLERLASALSGIEGCLMAMQEEVEGRLSRGITMLGNSRDDLRTHVARAAASLTAVRMPGATQAAVALPPASISDARTGAG